MGATFTDPYSLLHFATGVIAYFWGISLKNWFILHLSFEILENTDYGMYLINNNKWIPWPGGKSHKDSIVNSIGDQFYSMLGWYISFLISQN
jgi:hypothetical protein